MEMKRRMRTSFAWIVAVLALVAIGFLLACSTKYSASSNGLVIVPTQGTIEGVQATAVMETFSLDLANGQMSQINNVNGPPAPGLTGSIVLDPAGAHAYVIVTQTSEFPSQTGVAVFSVGSDGKLGTATTTTLNPILSTTVNCIFVQNGKTVTEQITVPVIASVVPQALAMDSAGKLLFVADVATSAQGSYTCNGATVTGEIPVQGAVSVFTVSSGTLTEVAGSPFLLPVASGGSTPSASALAVTPTAYPVQYSYCSRHTPPTTEYLYVTDAVNYVVLNYMVDPSAGTLSLMEYAPSVPGAPTGSVPSGVAVDPCNRFVYVANAGPGSSQNNVSAYTICSTINVISTPSCPAADFSLHPVTGSPYPAGDNPGPLSVDAYGNFLYVVNTGSGNVSGFRINAATGALAAFIGQPAAAGVGANSIAVRGDDSWVFVANKTSGTLSQYAITQSDGALNPVGPVSTLDLPSGVAVK
jgi:6-phosphogluconolactonase (cycloisomerase 2 family)